MDFPLTLATGWDRWERDRFGYLRLKGEGDHWELVEGEDGRRQCVLKPEVADWCRHNIGPYRIVEHIPGHQVGPKDGDSWRIEFGPNHERDAPLFKLFWL